MTARILIIAGSDSGGGAGIQADIKTVMMLGGHAMTAITAVTAQNSLGVQGMVPMPPELIAAQMESVVTDIGVDAIKIGMIPNAASIRMVGAMLLTLRDTIRRQNGGGGIFPVPVVVDPVMVATSGDRLCDEDAVATMFTHLFPFATVVTPNLIEFDRLGGEARAQMMGESCLIKGGHGEGEIIVDRLVSFGVEVARWGDRRIATTSTHGTGCTLSSAIATGLGSGLPLVEAIDRARKFVRLALRNAPGLGGGHGPMGHQAVRNDAIIGGPVLNQITVGASDYAASVAFYKALGLRQIVDSPDNGYARFEAANGATFSFHAADGPPSRAATVYFESPRLDEWVSELVEAGLLFDQLPQDESWLWREARLRDPFGNSICLYQAGENRRYPPWRI